MKREAKGRPWLLKFIAIANLSLQLQRLKLFRHLKNFRIVHTVRLKTSYSLAVSTSSHPGVVMLPSVMRLGSAVLLFLNCDPGTFKHTSEILTCLWLVCSTLNLKEDTLLELFQLLTWVSFFTGVSSMAPSLCSMVSVSLSHVSNKQFSHISPTSPLVATSEGCDAQLTKETEAKHTRSVQSAQHRINTYKNSSHFN